MDEQLVVEEQPEKSVSSDLIRGHINTIILRSLYDGDKYGYEIIAEIERKSHGQYTLKQPSLYSALKRLEKDGCDAIIVPCNTAHAFVPYLERHLGIPFINMQQTALDEIARKLGETARIGLLATSGTVQTGIY